MSLVIDKEVATSQVDQQRVPDQLLSAAAATEAEPADATEAAAAATGAP